MLRSLNMCGYLGEDSNDFCLDLWKGYSSIGPPNDKCNSCGAIMWEMEHSNISHRNAPPIFSLCCKLKWASDATSRGAATRTFSISAQ